MPRQVFVLSDLVDVLENLENGGISSCRSSSR